MRHRRDARSGKVFDSRYRGRTKTGSYRHYDVRAVPIERDGKIVQLDLTAGAPSPVNHQAMHAPGPTAPTEQ